MIGTVQHGDTCVPRGYLLEQLDLEDIALFQFILYEVFHYACDAEVVFCKMDKQIKVPQFKHRFDHNGIVFEIFVDKQP